MQSNPASSTICVRDAFHLDFYAHDLVGQSTRLKFDDFLSVPYIIKNGISQGAPSSGNLFQFYNPPLLEVVTDHKKSDARAYYDDTFLLAAARTFPECDAVLNPMASASRKWKSTHNSDFKESKFGMMRMRPQGRDDEQIPYIWDGTLVPHSYHIKCLGILIDKKLRFEMQAEAAATKVSTSIVSFTYRKPREIDSGMKRH